MCKLLVCSACKMLIFGATQLSEMGVNFKLRYTGQVQVPRNCKAVRGYMYVELLAIAD